VTHQTCHEEDCTKLASERKGLCLRHLRIHYPEEANILAAKLRGRQICKTEGCHRFIVNKNLCQTHLKKQFPESYGEQLEHHRSIQSLRVCETLGCKRRKAFDTKLCATHLKEADPIEYEKILSKIRQRPCKIEDCTSFSWKKGMCYFHVKEYIPEFIEEELKNRRITNREKCVVDTCENQKYSGRKYCYSHLKEYRPEVIEKRLKFDNRDPRQKVLMFYTNGTMKCQCPKCDITNSYFLTIDHINGDGAKHRRLLKRNSIYRWLISNNFPKGFQVLCFNCNMTKGANRTCGHFR